MNPTPESLFRIGQTRIPKSGPYLRSQDAQYVKDPVQGPSLRVVWQQPGLFGKPKNGDFHFRTHCVRIGKIPEKDVVIFAKEAAGFNAHRPNSTTWTQVAGALGGLAAFGIGLVSENSAAKKESGYGLGGISVFYTTGGEKNYGFFVAIASTTVIGDIVANFPATDVFEYAEQKPS